MNTTWVVHKFGGTSLADAGRYRAVGRTLLSARRDDAMDELLRGSRERGQVLRYVGTIDEGGRAYAGLRPFPLGHSFANLQGSENVVSFRTARYDARPLTVRDPGAGPVVTAAGVFSDMLRLASFPGATQ